MALSDKQKSFLWAVAAAVVVVVAAVALGVAAVLWARAAATPDHSTMTVCRPQYGNCTEATR